MNERKIPSRLLKNCLFNEYCLKKSTFQTKPSIYTKQSNNQKKNYDFSFISMFSFASLTSLNLLYQYQNLERDKKIDKFYYRVFFFKLLSNFHSIIWINSFLSFIYSSRFSLNLTKLQRNLALSFIFYMCKSQCDHHCRSLSKSFR